MMKLGEAASRLAKLDVLAPEGVRWATAIANRNFLIHQYDEIDRQITWATLSVKRLRSSEAQSLAPRCSGEAAAAISSESDESSG